MTEYAETYETYCASNELGLIGALLTYGTEVLDEASCEPEHFFAPEAQRIWAIAIAEQADSPSQLLDAVFADAVSDKLATYAGTALTTLAAGSGVMLGRLVRQAYAERTAPLHLSALSSQLRDKQVTVTDAARRLRAIADRIEELAR